MERVIDTSFPTSAVRLAALAAFSACTIYSGAAVADNPLVQTSYTADPAPMLHDGRLYLYTSHDEDVTLNNFFTMNDWRLYSTLDMVNWTDHGSPAGYKTFSWGTGDAWAPHGIAKNGKFYLYVPINNSTGSKIGVAVAPSPEGPFTDALGKALISTGSGNIDPTVFIDADGQAYLYWGNPDLYYVKLNADMISFSGSPTKVALSTAGFGVRTKTDRATAYEEGPWFYKRDSLYYLVYPADSTPEKLSYSTSSGPLGPWMYRGDIMAKQTGAGSSFTNHPGVIDYKGHSYLFYHNAALPGGGGYKRSVCVEEFTYGADGAIPAVMMSSAGPKAVQNLNPFEKVEAETIAFSSGLKTEVCSEGGMDVTSINSGDYIKVKNVDFGSGATSFDARVASSTSGGSIELRLDSQTGTLVGTCAVLGSGGAQTWVTKTCTVSGAMGVHDLFFKFGGGSGSLFNFNWWKFSGPGGTDVPNGGAGGGGAGPIGGAGGQTSTPDGGTSGAGRDGASGNAGTNAFPTGSGGSLASAGGSSSSAAGTPNSGGTTGGSTGMTGGRNDTAGAGSVGSPSPSSGCQSSPGGAGTTSALTTLALLGALLGRRRRLLGES
jgi:arabinoxylan arabinofuranohydrolase